MISRDPNLLTDLLGKSAYRNVILGSLIVSCWLALDSAPWESLWRQYEDYMSWFSSQPMGL